MHLATKAGLHAASRASSMRTYPRTTMDCCALCFVSYASCGGGVGLILTTTFILVCSLYGHIRTEVCFQMGLQFRLHPHCLHAVWMHAQILIRGSVSILCLHSICLRKQPHGVEYKTRTCLVMRTFSWDAAWQISWHCTMMEAACMVSQQHASVL